MNKKKFRFKLRSVKLSWLLSYLIVLLVPVLISVAVNYESEKMLRSEIHRANGAILEEVRLSIDSQIDNAIRLTSELTWNPRVRALLYSNYYRMNEDRYDLYMTAKELGLYSNFYPFVKNFYVYWREGQIVLLPGVYRDLQLGHNTIHEGERLSYELWMELLNTYFNGRFLKLKRSDSQGSALAYIHSFKGDKGDPPLGAIVVLLDTDKLLKVISSVQAFSGGEVMLLDETNRLLLSSSGSDTDPNLLFEQFAGEKGSFFYDFRGQRSEIFYMKSANQKITYVIAVPSKLYWEKAQKMNNLTVVALIISLAGGVLLTIYLLRINYNPINRILHALHGQRGPVDMKGNEFSYIQASIVNALSEKEQIHYKMKQQTNMLRSNMLSKLLKGKAVQDLPIEESFAAFNVDFKSDRFVVMLIHVRDYESFFERVPGESSLGKLKLMHFIMTNIVEELVNQKHQGVMIEVDDCPVCLINPNGADDEADLENLRILAEEAQRFLLNNFRIDTTISISGIKRNETGISEAYKEALDAMEYKFVVGGSKIITHDDIRSMEQDSLRFSYYYPMQVEQQLINQVRAGDYALAETIIRDIIEKNVNRENVSVVLVKCLMFNMIGTLLKTINEIADVQDSITVETWNKIDDLITCESVKQMERQFLAILSQVCEFTAHKRKQQQQSARKMLVEERCADIISFIQTNYADPNLNITMIADHFGMTQTYLSKFFKEHTGNGILDTINAVRLAHAKRLLAENGNSIKTIAAMVGFHEVTSFIRTFKKYEGVTPGQYQKRV
ncbi:AraC family transcriptional regulator [Paenibacillus alkalitolerans]|uniref:AraC family transcriptional regulator n=1 Tax=Paenibacillus alkalitolerans TaxID=2799335 RepID=UPI0018F37A57|nr:helix-turn-helix domain-containing protein [Paenibacillus alkalitolerans]